jgi:phage shock protein A
MTWPGSSVNGSPPPAQAPNLTRMANPISRWLKYFRAKADVKFEEKADPRIQLEQAISEAQIQHQRLREQAATIIANQKQAELRLNRTMEEFEKANGNARSALVMAQEARQRGDVAKATELESAAQSIATRMVQLDEDVEDQKTLVLQSTQAADQAKAAVQQNAQLLQQKLGERQKLLSQLEQAKMQETLNTAMGALNEAVGADVPTFDQVRTKIEARYAKAKGASELHTGTVQNTMLEIEAATKNREASARLDSLRAELGIPTAGELASPSTGELAPPPPPPQG